MEQQSAHHEIEAICQSKTGYPLTWCATKVSGLMLRQYSNIAACHRFEPAAYGTKVLAQSVSPFAKDNAKTRDVIRS